MASGFAGGMDQEAASFLQIMDTPDGGSMLKMLYAGSLVAVVSAVSGIYWNRGFLVIAGILSYLMALSTMTLAVKSVFVHQNFNYPKFVTSTHFLFCGIVAFSVMLYRQTTGQKKIIIPSIDQMSKIIVPIAIAFAASVGANNIALVHCNAAFSEMIGGAAPLCVIGICMCEGKVFNMTLLAPVLAVIAGVCLCAGGELAFTWIGFALVAFATFLRALKSHLQHKILAHCDAADKLDPVELLAWNAGPCLVIMLVWGGLTEGFEPIAQLSWDTSAAIAVTCVNACVLNVAGNFVIRDIGAVGSLLASQLKGILLLLGATVLLGEVIQIQQVVGYFFIAAGVYFYNKMESAIKEEKSEILQKDIENAEKAALIKVK